jgi:hypothetical protein
MMIFQIIVPPGSGIVHQVRNLTSFIHIKILSLLLGKLAELCGAITDNRLKALLGCKFCQICTLILRV